jgi:alpha-glucosidase
VLSNHDVRRHRTRLGGSDKRARAMAVLLLTLRGTPFLYAGEELGLEDAVVPDDIARDPGGRDGCRAPVPWTPVPPHGWPGARPWLPFPPDPEQLNAETESGEPHSMLSLYRHLLDERRQSPALQRGSLQRLDMPEGVLAFTRAHDDDRRTVVVNFRDSDTEITLDGTTTTVAAETAVLLRI